MCFVSRVVSNSVSRRLRSFSPVAEFPFSPKCPFSFSCVARFLSKLSPVCDLWRSVSIHSEEWMARLSRRTVTATPPGGAQSSVLLQLGCSPPCSTLPIGCMANLCRSSDFSCEWGNFRFPKISNLPFHFTPSISRVCDQLFARFEQAGWQGS